MPTRKPWGAMHAEPPQFAYAPGHPAFEGHFPGAPLLPGVLLADAALHALCELGAAAPALPLRLEHVKFVGVVRPGDALTLEFEPGRGGLRFVARHGARMVAVGSVALRRGGAAAG